MEKLGDIISSTLFLFGQYGIKIHQYEAKRYLKIKSKKITDFNKLFHQARSGIYCGIEKPVFHSDNSINNAINNFELGLELLLDKNNLEFKLRPKHEDMPEAIWYLQVKNENNKYVGRIGINIHSQKNDIIATIANIQGKFKSEQTWQVQVVKKLILDLNPNINIIRGIASSQHTSKNRVGFDKHRASCLYDLTFKNANMNTIRDSNKKAIYYELKR